MEKKLLYQAPNIQIYYDETENWLYVNWVGFQTVKLVKDSCEIMLDLLVAECCTKVLNDNTLIEGMWSGAAKWGAFNMFPRLRAGGLEAFAWVYSQSVLSRLSTERTINHMPEPPEYIKTFYELEEAKTWLRSV